MDNNMREAIAEFIDRRINYHRQNEPEPVNQAFMALRGRADTLRESLDAKQRALLVDAENAYRVSDGESGRYFYKAGLPTWGNRTASGCGGVIAAHRPRPRTFVPRAHRIRALASGALFCCPHTDRRTFLFVIFPELTCFFAEPEGTCAYSKTREGYA